MPCATTIMDRSSLAVLAVCLHLAHGAHLPPEVCSMYAKKGDVYIGGVFSLHGDAKGVDNRCKTRLPISALHVVEAMVFAVQAINDDDKVLPNVTLGFMIHDDCSRDEYAIWGSLALLMGAKGVTEGESCMIPGMTTDVEVRSVVGIVGTGKTSSSEVVASTSGLFERPLVSYGATGQKLLEENAFLYYFSTISSDQYKVTAILDLLDLFEWQYVALVYAADYDMLNMMGELQIAANRRRVCVHVQAMVSEAPTEKELHKMVKLLQNNTYAKVVVLLAQSAVTANAVFSAAMKADPPVNLTWVVGNSLANQDVLEEDLARGNLFVEYGTPELNEFEQYFRSMMGSKRANADNPWFDEFCGDLDRCLSFSAEGFSKAIPTLSATIDAVYALAFTLDEVIRRLNCTGTVANCLASQGANTLFTGMLHNVSFRGTRGDFKFTEYVRSVPGHFIIRNMQEIDGASKMVEIGSWNSLSPSHESGNETRLTVYKSLIQWNGHSGGETPRSVCRDDCAPGQVEEPLKKKCCLGCRECKADEIVKRSTCVQCREMEWPNDNQTECLALVPKTVTLGEPLVILLFLFACLGLVLCLLTASGMVRYRQHSLIKATSRELSCVNILGLVMGYLAVFPLLQSPKPLTCAAAQALYVLAFTLMYGSLLLKVNRIYRIFESSINSAKSPRFTGPRAQLMIAAVLVVIQALIMFITGVAVPNTWISIRKLFPTPLTINQPRTLENFCKLDYGFLVSMCYNAVLALACSLYAYKARNVPGNYNEAKFYAASVYTTLVLSLAALPVYFIAETALALAVSLSLVPIMDGYVTLLCIYLPKLYVVIFKKLGDGDNQGDANGGRFRPRKLPALVSTGNVTKVHPSQTSVE
ncbi:metabotropic glutamate receptor 4-like [Acanthaster planci]|uniref:Metabotropic glutamate receptor 4-like n=1 Tax=Acanthaster planci TaxID=133434 RepID=A0A8B7Z2X5_ACAPL|nr:metabotropic glutamate receptor 4-like [Acanthaster planci]